MSFARYKALQYLIVARDSFREIDLRGLRKRSPRCQISSQLLNRKSLRPALLRFQKSFHFQLKSYLHGNMEISKKFRCHPNHGFSPGFLIIQD